MSLIAPDQPFFLWAALFAIAALGFRCDSATGWIRNFGPAVVMVTGMLASNTGLLPRAASSYTAVWQLFIPLLIPLFLFGANLREVWFEARRLFLLFLIAATGTLVGVFVALQLVPLPGEPAKLAALFGATYIGGSSNFAAVGAALGYQDNPLMAPALAADAVVSVIYLLFLVAVSGVPRAVALFVNHGEDRATPVDENQRGRATPPLTMLSGTSALAVSAAICGVSQLLFVLCGGVVDAILFSTVITLMLATLLPGLQRHVAGHYDIGLVLIYLTFALIGVSADLTILLSEGVFLFLFGALIVLVHFLIVVAGARLFRFSLAEAVTVSNACALSPATAAALAGSRGWNTLITPAILVGVIGYAIANFVGILLARLLA